MTKNRIMRQNGFSSEDGLQQKLATIGLTMCLVSEPDDKEHLFKVWVEPIKKGTEDTYLIELVVHEVKISKKTPESRQDRDALWSFFSQIIKQCLINLYHTKEPRKILAQWKWNDTDESFMKRSTIEV